jgi:glutamate/tyrosine decarboxylase-like PLP-dependent enzyme
MGPVTLSICCFRYAPADAPAGEDREAYLGALNKRLMTELQRDGRVFCSNAVLRQRFALRVCIVNFRTEADDIDALLATANEVGARLHREGWSRESSAAAACAITPVMLDR